jgi:intracellular septation protein
LWPSRSGGIYAATAVAIVATIAQIAWFRYANGKVDPMQWVSLGVIVVFGGATILLQNENFIKWKPTVLYWLMGGALLVGQFIFKKNLLKSLMGAQMSLPESAWRVLNWSWTGFFAVMGVINLWVAFSFDTDTWVSFKLFGGLGLMALFVVAQAFYLSRFMKAEEAGKP